MPRTTRKRRTSKKDTSNALTKITSQNLATISEGTEEETLEAYLDDFEVQTATFVKQAKRRFLMEAKKILSILPPKSSIPKEISKMSAYEFQRRGGTLASVMESLSRPEIVIIEDKQDDQRVETSKPLVVEGSHSENKENAPVPTEADPNFVTPAMCTRSKGLTSGVQTTSKRQPKPLEHVTMSMTSAETGSPVDEHRFMQIQLEHAVEEMKAHLLEDLATCSFPQKWRSKIMKSMKSCKSQLLVTEDAFVTPATNR